MIFWCLLYLVLFSPFLKPLVDLKEETLSMTYPWFQPAERLNQLPPYLFVEMDRLKQEELKKGKKLISLSIGDPDLPTPAFLVEHLKQAVENPAYHQYPSQMGLERFRQAIVAWYLRRFGVSLKPDSEVLPLIGSKEGLAHLPLAFINPGDEVLVPDPAYPVYAAGTLLAGGVPRFFPLRKQHGFLPDLAELEKLCSPRTRLLFLNYPNNPTSATASLAFFEQVVKFAQKHRLMVCHDLAYSEIYFDGKKPPSFLAVPGASEVGCEFHSLSKTFNMTGWRVGFVVGHEKIVQGLARVKSHLDSGLFYAIQETAAVALEQGETFCESLRAIYQARRDFLRPALEKKGFECVPSDASFYLWAQLPRGEKDSRLFAMEFLKQQGLLAVPGRGFGIYGEGFLRFTLCLSEPSLQEVLTRLGTLPEVIRGGSV